MCSLQERQTVARRRRPRRRRADRRALIGGDRPRHAEPSAQEPVPRTAVRSRPRAVVLRRSWSPGDVGRLDAPLQDAAAVSLDRSRAMLLGGLTAADTSTDAVSVVSRRNGERACRTPADRGARRCCRAARRRSVYLFGGGDGARQHDEIVRIGSGVVGQPSGPELGSGRRRDRRHGVRRRRLHRARAGSTRSSRGRPAAARESSPICPSPVRYAAVAVRGRQALRRGRVAPERGRPALRSSSTRLQRTCASPCSVDLPRLRPLMRAAAELGRLRVRDRRTRGGARHADLARDRGDRPTHRTGSPSGSSAHSRSPMPSAISLGSRRSSSPAAGAPHGTQSPSLARLSLPAAICEASRAPPRPSNVYAADGPNMFRPRHATRHPPRVYVPNSEQQHGRRDRPSPLEDRPALPGRRAAAARHALLGPEDAVRAQRRGQLGHTDRSANGASPAARFHVADPYNMYFTPDGRFAIVVAERLSRLDFSDPHTFRVRARPRRAVSRRRPHGLLRPRRLPARQLRVLRAADQGRPSAASASSARCRLPGGANAAGREARA